MVISCAVSYAAQLICAFAFPNAVCFLMQRLNYLFDDNFYGCSGDILLYNHHGISSNEVFTSYSLFIRRRTLVNRGPENNKEILHFEPRLDKTHFTYAKTKAQISFAVTAKLVIAFVFVTGIVQFLYFLNPKFTASSHLHCLYSLVCVGPVQKQHCWFSHGRAHFWSW